MAPVLPGLFYFKRNSISKRFTLGKGERLKSRKLIESLFRKGKSFTLFPYKVFYVCGENVLTPPQTQSILQFGVGVSARNFKKAVDRNRVKRVTREAYRLQKEGLAQTLVKQNKQLALFIIYTGRDLPQYKTVSEKIGLILQRLIHEQE